jgi:hypothetical protein
VTQLCVGLPTPYNYVRRGQETGAERGQAGGSPPYRNLGRARCPTAPTIPYFP